jgi:hypothetical protein
LGGHDRLDAVFGEQRRPGRVLLEQQRRLAVQVGDLLAEESDPRGDRAQGEHGEAVLGGRAGHRLTLPRES